MTLDREELPPDPGLWLANKGNEARNAVKPGTVGWVTRQIQAEAIGALLTAWYNEFGTTPKFNYKRPT